MKERTAMMPDLENAALKAAETGHLVFSTIHAKTASETIKRLEDLGLSKSNLKETLTAVVNQRLYPNIKRKGRVCSGIRQQ